MSYLYTGTKLKTTAPPFRSTLKQDSLEFRLIESGIGKWMIKMETGDPVPIPYTGQDRRNAYVVAASMVAGADLAWVAEILKPIKL